MKIALGGGLVVSSVRIQIIKRREVMKLVNYQQRSIPLEFREVEVRRHRN
jgi:hypothetical protein